MVDQKEASDEHHEQLVSGLAKQMRTILDSSEQPIFLYLDDTHKTCNNRYATLLGYGSVNEWNKVENSFNAFVHEKSREAITKAYVDADQHKVGSTLKVTWNKKFGGSIETDVILVPMTYEEHLFAIIFVSTKS